MLYLLLATAIAAGSPAVPAAQHAFAPDTTIPDSSRSDAELRETVIRHASEVRSCYENEGLKRDPMLNGTLEISLRITATGLVDSVAVHQADISGVGMNEVSKCVSLAARNWRFTRGPFGVEQVVFPFHLSPDQVVAPVSWGG